jgi:ATP-dependent 26S proteasome regulatory subunit
MTGYKKTLLGIAALVLSHTAIAAVNNVSEIQESQVHQLQLQKKGTISISGVRGGLEDAIKAIKEKVSKQGGEHYRIVALDTPSDSSMWRGNAIYY